MRLALLLATLGAARMAAAQEPPPLDSAVVALMRASSVPGVAIAIVRADSIELHGYGVARVGDSAPVDPSRTLFRLASVAKLFVAASAAQQLDRGALALDAPVNGLLDGWRTADDITVLHLLTHTAGLDERLIGYAARSVEELEPLGEHLRRRLPRQGWRAGELTGYSNYGMALAGYLVERVTGLEFADYARRALFLPLGMARTFYRAVPDSLATDRATAHRCGGDGCDPLRELYSHPYPVGLAYSTAADMGRFVRALLGQGPADTVLTPRARAELFRERFRNEPTVPGISLGFFNQRHRGLPILAHSGTVPGTSGLLVVAPSRTVGFYFVANGGRSGFGAALRDTLLGRLLPDLEAPAPTPVETMTLPAAWLDRLAGSYLLTRYSHATVERFPMLFGAVIEVTRDGDGVALPMDGRRRRFLPLDSLHFREEGGERVLAFRRDERGRVTHLFAPAPVFGAEYPAALERLAWHDAPHFMNEYLSWLIGGPLLALLLGWPALALGSRWLDRRRGRPSSTGPWRPWVAALGFALLCATFGFGFIARSVQMLASSSGIIYGPTTQFRLLAAIPILLAPLGLLLGWWTVVAWRRGHWGPVRRTVFTAVTVAAGLAVAFLIRWNYLPVRF